MTSGVELIAAERLRQVESEGWTPEHDDKHADSAMAVAAACYALPAHVRAEKLFGRTLLNYLWPWGWKWWKPNGTGTREGRIGDLTKAGALIAAEIDRLQRSAGGEGG